jgi:hypothetical protein
MESCPVANSAHVFSIGASVKSIFLHKELDDFYVGGNLLVFRRVYKISESYYLRCIVLRTVACPAVPNFSTRHDFREKGYRIKNTCFDVLFY